MFMRMLELVGGLRRGPEAVSGSPETVVIK